MKKKKSDPDWRSDITAGCVIPGTEIMLLDLLKDGEGRVRELRLLVGERSIVLHFMHQVHQGTFGEIIIWEPSLGTYFIQGCTRTKLHPKDTYNPALGVRMTAKRLLYALTQTRLGGDPKEIYRAIRILIPEEDLRNASGGLVDPNKIYLVGE
jgi:hypothetical protein